tara:strand:- start:800 stop:1036 length:237 start_codon:yes stop_codon:yes gene_type:complete
MTNYTLKTCERLIDNYVNKHQGQVTKIYEGCLGLGKIMLHSAQNKCTIIIKEVYLNSWTSAHTIRQYKKMPKKYKQYI